MVANDANLHRSGSCVSMCTKSFKIAESSNSIKKAIDCSTIDLLKNSLVVKIETQEPDQRKFVLDLQLIDLDLNIVT